MGKIKDDGKEFRVITDKKIVVGKMGRKNIENEFHGLSRRHFDVLQKVNWWTETLTNDFHKVRAICDERDTFDEKTGVAICNSKLDYKSHIAMAKQYDRMHRLLQECAAFVYKKCEYHMNKAKAIDADMCKFYGRDPMK